MTKSNSSKNERRLRELLKKEATDSRPDFSQTLHERFCEAVRASVQHESDGARTVRGPNSGRFRPRLGIFTAAAACLAIATGVYWWSDSISMQTDLPAQSPNPLVTLADVAGRVTLDAGTKAENTMAANQWGSLNEDAKTAAKMLLESLPLNMLAENRGGQLAD